MITSSADPAMTAKDVWQLVVSGLAPFIAAGGALWIYSLQHRERISCFITFGYGREWEETSLISIHNRSSQPVAITRIRYRFGILFRKPSQGTALDYEDPTDLDFPYVVGAGEIRKLKLDEHHAIRLAQTVGKLRIWAARVLRRSRFTVECTTSTGAKYETSGEPILPWKDQLPWKRG
jgi:hypothetical protein